MRQIHAIKKMCEILQVRDSGTLTYNSEKVIHSNVDNDQELTFQLWIKYPQIPVLTLKNKEQVCGFVTILQHLMAQTSNTVFSGKGDEERDLLINQWIEYGNLFVHTISTSDDKQMIKALLDELNGYLVIRSYLVGESITVADLIVFFFIQDTMVSGFGIWIILESRLFNVSSHFGLFTQKYLTYLEKENYLNLSRWYNHIQQLDLIQKEEPRINLSTTYLVGWTTGTHS